MGASLLALAKPKYYNKSKKPRLQTRMGTVANLKKNQAQSLRKKRRFCRNPRHRKGQECPTYVTETSLYSSRTVGHHS